jgi:phosphate-selective porin
LTCLLTGEAKKKAVEPRKPLFRGPGAIELGVRYDDLHFDDEGPDSGFSGVGSRSRNLRPAAERALTGGLSWWPVSSLRFMASVVVERFEDPLLAPEPGRSSNYVTLLARFQLELP